MNVLDMRGHVLEKVQNNRDTVEWNCSNCVSVRQELRLAVQETDHVLPN